MKSLGIFVSGVVVGAVLVALIMRVSRDQDVVTQDPNNVALVESQTAKDCPVCPNTFSTDILPPPEFTNLPDPFVTNREGEVRVSWKEIKGAKGYKIHLENSKGRTVMTFKSSRTTLYLKEIPVPESMKEVKYWVRMVSVNGLDQDGERGPPKELLVKAMGSLMAPKVKEIRIED